MKYGEIPRPMRDALGTHEMLRRLGFSTDDIFWAFRVDKMMQIVLHTQGKEFVIDVGFLPHMTREQWEGQWSAVMEALLAKQISKRDYANLLSECEAYKHTADLVLAIKSKGIEIPASSNQKGVS